MTATLLLQSALAGLTNGFVYALVGLGLAGEGSHAPGERADLASLDVQAKRAALLITRLSKESRAKSRSR